MTEDERRTAALHSFYEAYRELQQYDNLRLHTHSSIYEKDDALIEIYRYQGEKKGERILKVTQEDEADAYEQAADQVKGLLERAKNETERRRRGMKEDKILPTEAAAIIGASPQFVRVGMQTGQLPIGAAVKMSSIWTYNISRDRLAEYVGRNIDGELQILRKQRA
jgi:hypothetical protein